MLYRVLGQRSILNLCCGIAFTDTASSIQPAKLQKIYNKSN